MRIVLIITIVVGVVAVLLIPTYLITVREPSVLSVPSQQISSAACEQKCIDDYGAVPPPSPFRGISRTEACILGCGQNEEIDQAKIDLNLEYLSDCVIRCIASTSVAPGATQHLFVRVSVTKSRPEYFFLAKKNI